MPTRILVHEEDYPRLLRMKKEHAGLVLQNLIRTLNGEPVEIIGDEYIDFFSEQACQKMMRFYETRESKSQAGKQGGAPVGNQNARKNKQKQAENNQKTSTKQAGNKQETSENKPYTYSYTYTNTYKDKKAYGECANVFLSDEEFEKIKSEGLENLIDELSLYIEASGKKYKSHYAVIRQWANRRKKEKAESVVSSSGRDAKSQFNRYPQRTDYDFAELEKKLTRN